MSQAASDFALSTTERDLLRCLIDRLGERAVVAGLGVSRQALGRALAGLPVRRGTIALVRAGLASLNLQARLENSTIKSQRNPGRGGRA